MLVQVATWNYGLARFHQGDWQVFQKENSGLPNNTVTSLAAQGDALWVGTGGGGLARFHQGDWQVFQKENSGLPGNWVNSLAVDRNGALWVGTDVGLARFHQGNWQVFQKENSGLPNNSVSSLAMQSDAMWVGTEGGLARFHQGDWQVFQEENSGLPNNSVSSLAMQGDALWVGTDVGLARFHQGNWQVPQKENSGLADNAVASLTAQGDALWVCTLGVGLARFHQDNWKVFQKENSGLPNNAVTSLAVDGNGVLWVGTVGGLARFNQDNWQVFQKENSGLPNNAVTSLAAQGDALWVGTISGGLARFHQDNWQVFQKENSGFPNNRVYSLAAQGDAMWVGTEGGLARFHKGDWQVLQEEPGGLPNNSVMSLAVDRNGVLWVGTEGGLARFLPPRERPQVDLVTTGKKERLPQKLQTMAARAFDPNYRTDLQEFRYHWTIKTSGTEKAVYDAISHSPFFSYNFEDGQDYTVAVRAVDRYGYLSAPQTRELSIAVPKPLSPWQTRLRDAFKAMGGVSLLYLLLLFPLVLLYLHSSLARTAVNSGVFTKFPLIHRTILNYNWARRHLCRQLQQGYLDSLAIPTPYIPQAVYQATDPLAKPLELANLEEFLSRIFTTSNHALLLGRSGTGKSVLLRCLVRLAAAGFLEGQSRKLPVLLDLRTRPIGGRKVEEVISEELKGHGLELPNDIIQFFLQKGGFLIMVDSLNEVDVNLVKNEFQAFLNRNAHNRVLMASQLDLLERRDIQVFNLAEITPNQAEEYLTQVAGRDLWDRLPTEVQALTHNPQDLALIGEVLKELAPEEVPTHRADLYRELLNRETALQDWVHTDSREIQAIYGLAFRMVDEVQRVLSEKDLTEWVREILQEQGAAEDAPVAAVVKGVERSRMFRREQVRSGLGLEETGIGFQHELEGKFLASRHLRMVVEKEKMTPAWIIEFSGDHKWQDVLFFSLDELNRRQKLNDLLSALINAGGALRQRLVAYALGTKPEGLISEEVKVAYSRSKIETDLLETPAPHKTGEPT
jgi:sugar lactone lactonase YvrE